jgi:hypothetical protein
MDQCGSIMLETPRYQTIHVKIYMYGSQIQVLGLLGHFSTYITVLTLNAYQTASLAVTLLTKCDENTHLEVGFLLRCFQRLSTPYLATQRLPLAR